MFYAQLEAVMKGEEPTDSVSASTLSFQIYREAVKVLAAHRVHRVQMMDDLPPAIGDMVRAEVLRIHAIRKAGPRPKPKVQAEPTVHRPEWNDWI
jgi:hypothetical protein